MVKRLNKKRIFAEIDATQDAHYRDRRPELIELVRILQRAASPSDFMRLQLELRDRFAARQDAMRLRRTQLEDDRRELGRLAPRKPQPRDAVEELRRRIAIRERLDVRDNVLQHVARCVADGMVWRATGFDRALFAVLGDRERVGRFAAEDGAGPERRRTGTLGSGCPALLQRPHELPAGGRPNCPLRRLAARARCGRRGQARRSSAPGLGAGKAA